MNVVVCDYECVCCVFEVLVLVDCYVGDVGIGCVMLFGIVGEVGVDCVVV